MDLNEDPAASFMSDTASVASTPGYAMIPVFPNLAIADVMSSPGVKCRSRRRSRNASRNAIAMCTLPRRDEDDIIITRVLEIRCNREIAMYI